MAAAAASNSLIERLILKYAKQFAVQNLELSVNLQAGEILVKNILLKDGDGLFRAIEQFIHDNKVDVWGCKGTPIIFPTGIEIEAGSVKEARVQIPVPNPFNGTNWQITLDGITGRLRTFPQKRREQLLKEAKQKAVEEAMKRMEKQIKANTLVGVPADRPPGMMSNASIDSAVTSSDPDDDLNSEAGHSNNQDGSQVWTEVLTGSWTRVQKRIDRYFREHLDVRMRSAEVTMHFGENPFPGYEDARWEFLVGECRLDLGVGQKVLPAQLAKAVAHAPCHQPIEPPPGRKVVVEEVIGVGFHQVDVFIRPGANKPAVAEAHFPQECFTLNLAKRQWEEKDPTLRNGTERIHVDLPDAFTVAVQIQHTELRACLVHMLHQIFDGVASAVPEYADWLTVPWQGGWQRSGALTAESEQDQDSLAIEYRELLQGQNTSWVAEQLDRVVAAATASSSGSNAKVNNNNSNAKAPWWSFGWPFKESCCSVQPTDLEGAVDIAMQAGRLAWFEHTQTAEWLAYWKLRVSKPDLLQNLPTPLFTRNNRLEEVIDPGSPEGRGDAPGEWKGWARHDFPPQTGSPQDTWRCWPYRRFEVTLSFGASFEVSLGLGQDEESNLDLSFPPGMALAMVRDLPAEWEIWANLPGLSISTEDYTWLTLHGLNATLGWGRRDMLPEAVKSRVPKEVPSVTRIQKVQVCPLTVFMSPRIVARILPLVAELPHVMSWPELWYLWGEWGYMQRPHAYMIDSVKVARIRVNMSSEDYSEIEAPLVATKSFKVQTQAASLHVNVRHLSLSSLGHCIYVDKSWQPWWNLRVDVGETSITAVAFHRPLQMVSYANVTLTASRLRPKPSKPMQQRGSQDNIGEDLPEVLMSVHAQEAKIQVAPKVVQCGRMLAVAYETACRPVMMPALKRMQEAAEQLYYFCKRSQVTCRWLWPAVLKVQCEDLDHLEIFVQNAVASSMRIKPFFRLIATLHNPATDDELPMVRVEMDRAGVEVDVLDDSLSQSWEPLLEPWGFKLKAELYVPPEPRLVVELASSTRPSQLLPEGNVRKAPTNTGSFDKIPSSTTKPEEAKETDSSQKEAEPLHLTISSTVVKVSKELIQAWFPQVMSLVSGKWREVQDETGPRITALNLCPVPVTATVRTLPSDVSEVVVKLQSIFRGRRTRAVDKIQSSATDRVKKNASEQVSNVMPMSPRSMGGSNSASPKVKATRFKNPGANQLSMLVLAPGRPHPLLVEETQRLALNFNGVPRVLGSGRDFHIKSLPGQHPGRGSSNSLASVFGCGGNNGKGRSRTFTFTKQLSRASSTLAGTPVGRLESLPSNVGMEGTETVDNALMNVCRNGHTKFISSVGSDANDTAYICEVISPTLNDRMLVIHSPVRIFNYTEHRIAIGFFCGEDQLPVEDGLPKTCTTTANLLGHTQPVFPLVYGLSAPEVCDASGANNAWELASKCVASVPVHLRNADGGVHLRFRYPSSKAWKCRSIRTNECENNEIVYYSIPDSHDFVRLLFKRRRRTASAIIASTGPPVDCWDIVILPTFSLASLHPMPLDVQVIAGSEHKTVELERGKIKNLYSMGAYLAERKPLSIRVKPSGTGTWSAAVKVQYDRFHHKEGEVPLDEQIKLPVADHTASTEVTLRHADVALLLPPIWLCDKTGLGLKATDRKGREFPKAGDYSLLDTSMGDNYLTLQLDKQDSIQVAMSPSIQSNAARRVMLTTEHTHRKSKPSEYTMFPLAIETKDLGHMLGTLRCPPMQVLTVRPGVMIKSDVPLLLRQPGFESQEVSVPADVLTPVWFRWTPGWSLAGNHQCVVQLKMADAQTDWSGKIICEPGAAGVHAVVLPPVTPPSASPDSNSTTERGPLWFLRGPEKEVGGPSPSSGQTPRVTWRGSNLKTLSVEVSDNEEAVVVVTVSAKKSALTISNNSSIAEVAGIETDAPGQPPKPSTNQVAQLRPAAVQKSSSGFKLKSVDSSKDLVNMPGHSFTCPYGEDTAIGWFEPFAKGAQTHKLRLWLSFKESSHVCGPIEADLYSAWSYFLLMPDSMDTEEMIVINFSQGNRCYRVSIDSEPVSIKRGCQAVCGHCGTFVSAESLRTIAKGGLYTCSRCKGVMFISVGDSIKEVGSPRTHSGGGSSRWRSQSLGLFELGVSSKDLNPFSRLLALKELWGLMVLDVDVNIGCVGISIVSKRMECEVAYVIVDGIHLGIKAPEGILITHVLHMSVMDVRCDRMFEKVGKTPAIFASTPLEDSGDSPAFSLTVVRPFVTAQAICLKEVRAKFGAQWEVALDTEAVNALLDFHEECIVALGNPLELFKFTREKVVSEEDGQKCMAEMQAVLQRHGTSYEDFMSEHVPVVIQLESLEVDTVEAKVWVTLQLSRMAFVPPSAARLMKVLTLSDQVELNGASVKIAPVHHEARRGSGAEVGRALLMSYLPQLVSTGARLLGASNLHRFATGVPYAISHVMLKSSDVMLSAVTLGHGDSVKSSTRKALGIRQSARRHSTDPVSTGEARLREPRLIFANARITLYNALHAELLTRLGQDVLKRTLHVFIVAEDPVLALIVRTDALVGCSFSNWLTDEERRPSKGGNAKDNNNNNNNGKGSQIYKPPAFDQTLLGPWPWTQVLGLEALPDGRLELSLQPAAGQGAKEAKIVWPSPEVSCVFKERAELRLACSIVSRMVRTFDYNNSKFSV